MSAFLTEVGGKLADRWASLLLLPGLLWVGTLTAAVLLGQADPFNVTVLRDNADRLSTGRAAGSAGTVILTAAGVLLASAAAGLAAAALGGLAQRGWAQPGGNRPLAWLARLRQHRWDRATAMLRAAIAQAAKPQSSPADRTRAEVRAREAAARRERLGSARPERPTWIGDRFRATAVRGDARYGLDLTLTWPRLWTVLEDPLRTDLGAAQDAYAASARLAGWAVLYAALAAAWWPAAVVGIAVFAAAVVRARSSAVVLADLIDTAIDLHTADLAARLGVPASLPLTAETGKAITRALN